MSTLLQLVNEVLRRTGQTQVSTLVGAEAPALQTVDFINEVYTEMLQRLKVNRLQRQATLNTVASTPAYSLAAETELNALIPDSLMETGKQIRLMEVDYTYPLTHGVSATGRPEAFYRRDDQIHLYPVPDGVYTISYQYWVKPATLSANTDTTELPTEWEKVLVLGTQARLEKFLGESADDSFLLYRDGLVQLKARAANKPHHRMQGFYRGGRMP